MESSESKNSAFCRDYHCFLYAWSTYNDHRLTTFVNIHLGRESGYSGDTVNETTTTSPPSVCEHTYLGRESGYSGDTVNERLHNWTRTLSPVKVGR
jgi:hypothetical protein